jgi:hypothetical protein
MTMPVIPLDILPLDLDDLRIVQKIVVNNGKLRRTKPADPYGQYVWRMVLFYVSPYPQHHCIPTTHDVGLFSVAPRVTKVCPHRKREIEESDYAWIKAKRSKLDRIVDAVVNIFPPASQTGFTV